MMDRVSPAKNTTSRFFEYPYSLTPLPPDYSKGLIAPGITGSVSAVCCIAMLSFIVYRYVTWRIHYKAFMGYNQYVTLIIHLLVADLMQGISMTFSFSWIARDGILAPSRRCFNQGFLLNLGDLASGFFVFGIALHTYFGAVHGRRVKNSTLTVLVLLGWLLAVILTGIGPIVHRDHYFVRAGAWCWVNQEFETERLALHYVWIFLVQFSILLLYALIFIHLKRTISGVLPGSVSPAHSKIDRVAKLMITFPITYIILTLPLSAGRMWSHAHTSESLPTSFSLVAGCMLSSSGMVDCLLYTLTRRSLLQQTLQPAKPSADEERRCYKLEKISQGAANDTGITKTRTVTVKGDRVSELDQEDDDDDIGNSACDIESLYPSTPSVRSKNPMDQHSMTGAPSMSLHGDSQDRYQPWTDHLDPRKTKYLNVTVSAIEAGNADSLAARDEMASSRTRLNMTSEDTVRDDSPHGGVRRVLELLGSTSK